MALSRLLTLGGFLLLISGCGGGSSGGGPARSATPQLTAVTPTANAPAHPVNVTTFAVLADRDLDAATVNDTTVFVIESGPGGHGRLAGAVTYTAASRLIEWTLASG